MYFCALNPKHDVSLSFFLTITHSSIMTRGIHHSKLDSQGKRGAICIVFKVQVDTEVSKYIYWSCEIEGECGPG